MFVFAHKCASPVAVCGGGACRIRHLSSLRVGWNRWRVQVRDQIWRVLSVSSHFVYLFGGCFDLFGAYFDRLFRGCCFVSRWEQMS